MPHLDPTTQAYSKCLEERPPKPVPSRPFFGGLWSRHHPFLLMYEYKDLESPVENGLLRMELPLPVYLQKCAVLMPIQPIFT
jgi:hypothetical protein